MDVDIVTDMPEDAKNVSLIIRIENKQPIELSDLTKSFNALANQFNEYATQSVDHLENRQGKLFVREIKTGSVIVELIEIATIGVIPFMENVNTIVGFGEYVKKAFDFILSKTKEKPKELKSSGYRDLSQIVNPIAKDSASQLNVSTVVNGNVYLDFNIGNIEANAVQNIVQRILKEAKGLEDVPTH